MYKSNSLPPHEVIRLPWRQHAHERRRRRRKRAPNTCEHPIVPNDVKSEDISRDLTQERWIQKHQKKKHLSFTASQRQILRDWFESMDSDGQGEISVEELHDPLISIGAASSIDETRRIIRLVDKDNSGAVSFNEFMAAFTPQEDTSKMHVAKAFSSFRLERLAMQSHLKSFTTLTKHMEQQSQGSLSVHTEISTQRRKYLLDSLMEIGSATSCRRMRGKLEAERAQNMLHMDAKHLLELRQEINRQKRLEIEKSTRLQSLQTVVVRKTHETQTKNEARSTKQRHMLLTKIPCPNAIVATIEPKQPCPLIKGQEKKAEHRVHPFIEEERKRRVEEKAMRKCDSNAMLRSY